MDIAWAHGGFIVGFYTCEEDLESCVIDILGRLRHKLVHDLVKSPRGVDSCLKPLFPQATIVVTRL